MRRGVLTLSIVVVGGDHVLVPEHLLSGVEGSVVDLLQLTLATLVTSHQQSQQQVSVQGRRALGERGHQVQVGGYVVERPLTGKEFE